MQQIEACLHRVKRQQIGNEVDGSGGVAQRFEQPNDARMMCHGQGDIYAVDAIRQYVLAQIADRSEQAAVAAGWHSIVGAIIEKADELGARQTVFAQGPGKAHTYVGRAYDDYAAGLQVFRAHLRQQSLGAQLPRPDQQWSGSGPHE